MSFGGGVLYHYACVNKSVLSNHELIAGQLRSVFRHLGLEVGSIRCGWLASSSSVSNDKGVLFL